MFIIPRSTFHGSITACFPGRFLNLSWQQILLQRYPSGLSARSLWYASDLLPYSLEQGPNFVIPSQYLIVNLGISKGFGFIDPTLTFPTKLRVDWIRVYEDPDAKNIGCDPPDFPTKAYIDEYMEAYTNPNLTTWRYG